MKNKEHRKKKKGAMKTQIKTCDGFSASERGRTASERFGRSADHQKKTSKRAAMNAQVKTVSKAFGVRAIRPLGASSNKQSTKGAMKAQKADVSKAFSSSSNQKSKRAAMEVDTLAGFVIIVIFLVVIITIILKNKEFIQRLLP